MATHFFAFEGTDGGGKSTIAGLVQQTQRAAVIECPMPPLDAIKDEALTVLTPNARLLFFMAANLQVSERVAEADGELPVISVRYIWSTLAYHATIESCHVSDIMDFVDPLLRITLLPEKVIYLSADRSTQFRRLEQRNESSFHTEINRSDDFQARLISNYDEAFALVSVPVVQIDTGKSTPAETLQLVVDALRF